MSAAFDTIIRSILMSIIDEIAEEDERRMVRILLSDTKLEVRISGFEEEEVPFQSNRGSPQGDSLSGPHNTYFITLWSCFFRFLFER